MSKAIAKTSQMRIHRRLLEHDIRTHGAKAGFPHWDGTDEELIAEIRRMGDLFIVEDGELIAVDK